MADFIRSQDHYHHLITTSSNTTQQAIWPALDYYQAHAYPSDLISAIAGLDDQKLTRPYFYGEMGAAQGAVLPPGDTLHQILWASLMSGSAGTGEYWAWFEVEPRNLLGQFTSVQEFIKQSGVLNDRQLRPARFEVHTPLLGPLQFGPGRDWAASTTTRFVIHPSGFVENLGGMPAFLQGTGANHAMFPSATFEVNYSEPGTLAVELDEMTAKGARLEANVDGKSAATLILGPQLRPNRNPGARSPEDPTTHLNEALEIPVSAGPHTIRLENTGQDWVRIRQFVLTPYAPQIAVLGKSSDTMAVLWAYCRATESKREPVSAEIKLDGLTAGSYRVAWWDTDAGKIITQTATWVVNGKPLTLTTPTLDEDAACWITRSN
jgi:hypothetical protein